MIIVDFQNEFKRAFAISVDNLDAEGSYLPVYIVLNMIKHATKKFNDSRVLIVNDGGRSKKIIESYKDNRRTKAGYSIFFENLQTKLKMTLGIDDALDYYRKQRDTSLEVLQSLYGEQILFYNVEADDVIGILPILTSERLFILSTDKDFFQLLSYTNVSLYRKEYNRNVVYSNTKPIYIGRKFLKREVKLYPELIPVVRAFLGDPSDNIPGIKGIGPAKIAKLIDLITEDLTYEEISKIFFEKDSEEIAELVFSYMSKVKSLARFITNENKDFYQKIIEQISLSPKLIENRLGSQTYESIKITLKERLKSGIKYVSTAEKVKVMKKLRKLGFSDVSILH